MYYGQNTELRRNGVKQSGFQSGLVHWSLVSWVTLRPTSSSQFLHVQCGGWWAGEAPPRGHRDAFHIYYSRLKFKDASLSVRAGYTICGVPWSKCKKKVLWKILKYKRLPFFHHLSLNLLQGILICHVMFWVQTVKRILIIRMDFAIYFCIVNANFKCKYKSI